jgi:hypothetical protein
MVFCALARETTARRYYTAAWHTAEDEDLTELEHALEELLHARQYWTDAMLSLELLLLDTHEEPASGDSLRTLLVEVMQQRARVNLLVQQTQQEQLAAYRGAGLDQPRGGERPHPPTTTKRAHERTTPSPIMHTAADCPIYGHNWQTSGMSGEKRCTACGVVGYCPICTPHPQPGAHPFYCARHTPPTERTVRA